MMTQVRETSHSVCCLTIGYHRVYGSIIVQDFFGMTHRNGVPLQGGTQVVPTDLHVRTIIQEKWYPYSGTTLVPRVGGTPPLKGGTPGTSCRVPGWMGGML